MMWTLLGIFIGALGVLIWQGVRNRIKGENDNGDKPAWEALAIAHEKAALEELKESRENAQIGYSARAEAGMKRVKFHYEESKRIRAEALEAMMEGKIL